MKKSRVIAMLLLGSAACLGFSGCGSDSKVPKEVKVIDVPDDDEDSDADETDAAEDTSTEETAAEDAVAEETDVEEADVVADADLPEDGVYEAKFNTDSSMFHVNEACEGKGTLTVENGKMTIHVSLVSKHIVNLFYGTAADAQKDGAELIDPTIDHITYKDGYEEDVFGFDIPVPALDTDYNVALIGEHENWYDHTVSVSDIVPME